MLNLIQHLQRGLLSLQNGVRGRSRIKYGTTSLFDNGVKAFTPLSSSRRVLVRDIRGAIKNFAAPIPRIETLRGDEARHGGFTLIELLVVVLIIGILAAVALPKYEQAVLKSRMSAFFPIIRAIDNAEQVFHLKNGTYTADIEELDIDLPAASACHISRLGSTEFYSVGCAERKTWTSFEKYFHNSNITCWAAKSNPVANRVCKSLGGTSTQGNDTFNAYNLPM